MAHDVQSFFLDLRMRDVGGAVHRGKLKSIAGAEMTTPVDTSGRLVVFLLHGFNVDGPTGRASLGKFMELLAPRLHDAVLIGVLWPGDSVVRALSYSLEGRMADDAAKYLEAYIRLNISEKARLAFVGHSKGCRVAMRTIDNLAKPKSPHQIVAVGLMAAAIDCTVLTDPGPKAFATATLRTRGVSVLWSRYDQVLRFAYPAGDLLQGFVYATTDEPGFALGLIGPRHRRKANKAARELVHRARIPEDNQVDHGDYLPSKNGEASINHERAAAWVAGVLAGNAEQPYA